VPLLERMGRPEPAERPTAGEVAVALLGLAGGLPRPDPLPVVGVDLQSPAGDDALTVLPTDAPTGYLPAVGADEPPAGRRNRRRWVLAGIAALLLVAAGGGAGLWAVTRPPTYPVPEVQGALIDDAEASLRSAMAAAGDVTWTIERRDEYSRTVAKGAVTSQRPAPGFALRDGGTVTLGVSLGPPLAAIPGLDGKTFAEAKALLEGVRLLAVQTPVNDEAVPAGAVVTWRVGEVVKPPPQPEGTTVEVLVSSGPAQRKVPAFAGQSEAQLKAALEALQLVVARQEAFSATVPIGGVVGTTPPEGTMVDRGSTVTIIVSKGPDLVKVPELIGLSRNDADTELKKVGLEGNFIGSNNGRVFATNPSSGTMVARGSKVTVAIG
jgi:serine/threonine-protein kinase